MDEIKLIEKIIDEEKDGRDIYCFFADPAEHSLSPMIYNTAFEHMGIEARYIAFRVPEGRIGETMDLVRTLPIKGCNVSMPHKKAVMEYLDEISNSAVICDAVNTIINTATDSVSDFVSDIRGESKLVGHNTDCIGAVNSIKEMGTEISDSNIVMFGLGGAGKAVLSGMAGEGALCISVFVRSFDNPEHSEFIEKIKSLFPKVSIAIYDLRDRELLKDKMHDASVLINSTSVGMGKTEGVSLIPDLSFLHKDLTVMDAIYSPRETELLKQAKAAGCKRYANGLTMLIHQGSTAFKLYTDQDMPIDLVRDAITK